MSWVKEALEKLQKNEPVCVRPLGGSMRGKIESGQLVTLVPATLKDVTIDDAIFVRWKGNFLLHLVKEIRGDEILIGNNLGKINGWVSANAIIGKVIKVEE